MIRASAAMRAVATITVVTCVFYCLAERRDRWTAASVTRPTVHHTGRVDFQQSRDQLSGCP